jgi:hypothetical protein
VKEVTGKVAIEQLKQSIPSSGLFRGKSWKWSDQPWTLDPEEVRWLEGLGKKLAVFQRASDKLYRESVLGNQPRWVSEWLDLGKPEEVVRVGCEAKGALPRLIRPDLIRAESGWALTEIDSVPGGVGLTAWLQEEYSRMGHSILGGANGMRSIGEDILGEQGEVVISEEAGDYRPEWEWLVGKDRVQNAESYRPKKGATYRFFEMFDWMGLEGIRNSKEDGVRWEAPLKAYLEEKLWWALFWMKPLEEWWRKELGEGYFKELRALVPRAWPLRPMELEGFSQKARELVVKISGFSPRAWGSKGVFLGSDHPKERWVQEVKRALGEWSQQPHLLQKFAHPLSVNHPVWSEERGEMIEGKWRLRLCPYYLVTGEKVELKGALATLCPTDKKLIHGMEEAVLVPVGTKKGPTEGP